MAASLQSAEFLGPLQYRTWRKMTSIFQPGMRGEPDHRNIPAASPPELQQILDSLAESVEHNWQQWIHARHVQTCSLWWHYKVDLVLNLRKHVFLRPVCRLHTGRLTKSSCRSFLNTIVLFSKQEIRRFPISLAYHYYCYYLCCLNWSTEFS